MDANHYKLQYHQLFKEFENYKTSSKNEINKLKLYNKELEKENEYLSNKVMDLEAVILKLKEQIDYLGNNNNVIGSNSKLFSNFSDSKSLVNSITSDFSNNLNNLNYNSKLLKNIDKLYNDITKARMYLEDKSIPADKRNKIIDKIELLNNNLKKITDIFTTQQNKIESKLKNIKTMRLSYNKNIDNNFNITQSTFFKRNESTVIENNSDYKQKYSVTNPSNDIKSFNQKQFEIDTDSYSEKLFFCKEIVKKIRTLKL